MKPNNPKELKKYILLSDGSIVTSHYNTDDDEKPQLRHFDYDANGDLCLSRSRYDEFDRCYHYELLPVLDTSESEQELALAKKER